MGMFDYIVCAYPLPGKAASYVDNQHLFQTKDLDCYLDTYLIDEKGNLLIAKMGIDGETEWQDKKFDPVNDFTGTIDFYTSNIRASGPGVYTAKGEDVETVGYEANFKNGKLIDIVQTEYSRQPALPSSEFKHYQSNLKYEDDGFSFLGRKFYITHEECYADVVADSKKDFCVKLDDETLIVLHKKDKFYTYWDSKEAWASENSKSTAHWKVEAAKFDEYKATWALKNKE